MVAAPVASAQDGPEESPAASAGADEVEALEETPPPPNLEPLEQDPPPLLTLPPAPPPRRAPAENEPPERATRTPTPTVTPTAAPTPRRSRPPTTARARRAAHPTRAAVSRACLARLPRLERRVLALRAGFRVPRPWSRRQVAIALRLSDARVLQLERRARRRAESLRRRDACRRPEKDRDERASAARPLGPGPPPPPRDPLANPAGPWDLGSALDVPAIIAALALIVATVAVARKTWRRPAALAGASAPPPVVEPSPPKQRLWATSEGPPDDD